MRILSRLVLLVAFLFSCCALFVEQSARAQTPPLIQNGVTVSLRPISNVSIGGAVNDFATPLTNLNRQYIARQSGTIRIIENGTLQTTPFLSSIPNLISGGESGLIGMTFHPDFNVQGANGFGKFYTFSSQTDQNNSDFYNNTSYGNGQFEALGPNDASFQNVVREWSTTNPSEAVFSGTSRVLFSIGKFAGNHNGGGLAFGPDKNLYIAIGDGGDSNDKLNSTSLTDGHTNLIGNAQDKNVAYGKILRINPLLNQAGNTTSANGQYGIPTSNPFVNKAGLDEIFAYGLRNPFRFSFDAQKLYIGDVGQGLREEIDLINLTDPTIADGKNFGWGNIEGSVTLSATPAIVGPTVAPLSEYTHTDGGVAIIGGFVNHNPFLAGLPSLDGKYVFGDANGQIYYLDPSNPAQIFRFVIAPGTTISGGVNGMGQDQNGNLYVLTGNGQVLQIIPEPACAVWVIAIAGLLLCGYRKRRVAGVEAPAEPPARLFITVNGV